MTQRKTDIEANEQRSLNQKNVHGIITKHTDITLSTDFRDSRKFVSKLVHIDSYRNVVQFVRDCS